MHIMLSSDEFKELDASVLPNETTLVEFDSEGTLIKSYIIKESKFSITRDFVENDRPWAKGEEAKFTNDKGRAKIFDFFLNYNDDGPQREYNTMGNLEYKHLSFIRHDGSYKYLDDDTRYNIFKIIINRDSDLNKAERELSWALTRIANFYEEIDQIEIKIFEHTLSAHGIYDIMWDKADKFEVRKTIYGHTEVIKEFNSLKDLIKYISTCHYYE